MNPFYIVFFQNWIIDRLYLTSTDLFRGFLIIIDSSNMDSFEEWAKTAEHPCFQEWGETAVKLGASWDTFKRKSKDAIVVDLVTGGIPILAARDMTDIASAEVRKSQEPMAVFWDLENMPIPAETSGRDITSSIKAILSHHGDLIQFRGYASIGLNHIPQEKRSDLQLSGCHLVDCPHHGRKEVADKMIIVDAMQFAFQHPNGATLCFITGDVDYAYLLATLQRPQWRTIVISRGTMQSMLHVNCDMKMRWETDILHPIYEMGGGRLQDNPGEGDVAGSNEISTNSFTPLTADEEWSDDIELLRSIIKQLSQKLGSLAPRKSLIGNILRSTNPARFPQRIMIQSFLMKAIDQGVVIESGDGAFKALCLPAHAGYPSSVPTLALSHACPVPQKELSAKTLEKAKIFPFVIFLRKMHCPSGSPPPPKGIVQSTTDWLLYMFSTQLYAKNAVHERTWLQSGIMVDLRERLSSPGTDIVPQQKIQKGKMVNCAACLAMFEENSFVQHGVCSVECKDWAETDSRGKERGVKLVVETLEFLATYDDIYFEVNHLKNLIILRYPKECSSRKLSKLWIIEAEGKCAVKIIKRVASKKKYATLPANSHLEESYFEIGAVDTSEQENFLYNILFEEKCGWIDRIKINLLLSEKFGMDSPGMRNQVFFNARSRLTFFIAKGGHNQIVALNQEEAVLIVLETVCPTTTREESEDGSEEAAMGGHKAPSCQSSCVDNSSDDGSSDEEDLEAFICSRR